MSLENFHKAKTIVRTLGDPQEVQRIIEEIETLEIRREYFDQLDRRPGQSAEIYRELAWKYHRSIGKIKRNIYT